MKIFDWNKPILCLETKELLRDDVADLFEVLHVILDINHFGLVPLNFVYPLPHVNVWQKNQQ